VRGALPFALVVFGCAKSDPPVANPVQSVSVAPQGSGSPNEPVLVVGPTSPADPPGDVERVKVSDERPDVSWHPPKDRCPEGVNEMMAAHVPLGDSMELQAGATPVLALGAKPDSVEVIFDRSRKTVRVTARKFGLVYVLVERDHRCTFYGVTSGY